MLWGDTQAHASFADKPTAEALARPELALQSSIAESHRCAREIDGSVVQFRELLEKVAASPFVTHMRQLKAGIVG
jgi:hypothetical protein